MTELVEFLRARLAEDERRIDQAREAFGDISSVTIAVLQHFQRKPTTTTVMHHDPERERRETEVKRRIIELCANAEIGDSGDFGAPLLAEQILSVLALPYADHPDYRAEWKP